MEYSQQDILDFEVKELSPEQEKTVLPFLLDFIKEHRNSKDEEEIVVVGSAIRTYMAWLDIDRMDEISELLEPDFHNMMSQEVELQFMIMANRVFAVHPQADNSRFKRLEDDILKRVTAYGDPYILSRGKFAAIAMNGIQALAGMHSIAIYGIIMHDIPFKWFREQLKRRLKKMEDEWREKIEVNGESILFIENLQELL